jgi:hypothetical protein
MELMDIDVELRNKLESVRGAMERLGTLDPEKKMQDIIEDQEWVASLDSLYSVASQPPSPDNFISAEEAKMNAEDSVPESVANKAKQERAAQESGQPSEGTEEESPTSVEERTGQPSERTTQQKSASGRGGV